MKQNNRAYGLLLSVMAAVLTIVLSIGMVQARYDNTAVWNTLISHVPSQPLSADCLVEGGQIILLDDLAQTGRVLSFSLETKEDVEQALTWTCNQPEYLAVTMTAVTAEGEYAVDPSVPLVLTAGSDVRIDMKLLPSDAEHGEMPVDVAVSFGDLSGTFRTTIPEVVIPETTDPSETTTEPSEETTAPTETTEPTEETTAPSEETTEPSEDTTEPVKEQLEPTEEIIIPTEPSPVPAYIPLTNSEEQPDDSTETEPVKEPALPAPDVQMLSSFEPDGMLPVVVTLPENTDRVQLGLAVEQIEEITTETETVQQVTTVCSPFPAYTRYALDGVWYMLYDGGYITANAQTALVLDASSMALPEDGTLKLMAQAYLGAEKMGQTVVQAAADANLDGAEVPRFLSKETGLTESASFAIDLPAGWIDTNVTMSHSVQMLSRGENGTLWQPVELPAEGAGLYVQNLSDAQTNVHCVMVSLAEPLQAAGTYRLDVQMFYQDLCFAQTRTIFFVNDSITVESDETVEESTAENTTEADVE